MTRLFWKLLAWVEDHLPVICACCGQIHFAKDVVHRQRNDGNVVPLCRRCNHDIFAPFSERGER